MKTVEMELALASWFDYRMNLIVPNVHWGLEMHECDLLCLSQAGYATEVEIKISIADLRADAKKAHGHRSGGRIKFLWFAFPTNLKKKLDDIEELVPERAGILFVKPDDDDNFHVPKVRRHREAVKQPARKFTDLERYKLARLGALRIWNLKRKAMK